MAPNPSIGTTIRKARDRKRMSQDELAAALGVSRSAVNAWENGRAVPRNPTLVEDVLGISLDDDDRTLTEDQLEERLQRTESALQRALDELRTGPGNGKRAS